MRVLLTGIFCGALSACASVIDFTPGAQADFTCQAVDGVGCVSTQDIDKAVVSGAAAPSRVGLAGSGVPVFGDALYRPRGGAEWKDSEILVVRFGEFVDVHGNYHDPSKVRAVISRGGWK